MILRWFSREQPGAAPIPPESEFHGGDRSLSALWILFNPDICPVPVPDTGRRYCRNTAHWCTRNDRSVCSAE